jgi:hypothetical protein
MQHSKVNSYERGRTLSWIAYRFTRRAPQPQQPIPERSTPCRRRRCDQLGARGELRVLRSTNAGWTNRPGGTDIVRPLQPTKRRLTATPRAKRRSSLGATAELLSAGTLDQLTTVDSVKASSPKGQTTSMQEFVQIDFASEHACGQPSVERWHVLEPVSERWSWVRVYGCCKQVAFEPVQEEKEKPRVKRAA